MSDDSLAHLAARWDRERAFHDAVAEQLDPSALAPSDVPACDDALLSTAGVMAGARVLDVGCGQGDLTLQLLRRGALVTGLDLSERMLAVARRRVGLFGTREARFVAAPLERTGLPSASFDVIVGRWILHHVDLHAAAPELARLLAPGGRAVFLENSGANPVLNAARKHLAGRMGIPRLGTADERPLIADDWTLLQHAFTSVRPEYPVVDIFELLDRQCFRYRSRGVSAITSGLDRLIARTRLRRYSYRVLVVAER
ncbi:MAG: class I SAM-dependent methyltransferase [Solirubrobacteraceae bacterium]